MSFTRCFNTAGELRGITSIIVRSSTYLILGPQEHTRSSTMTANKIGLNLVPCGIPPFRDDAFQSWTRCDLPWRKAAIHLTKEGCNPKPESLQNNIRWSIRSKPFLKCAKKKHNAQLPLSSASNARWSKYTNAWEVDLPDRVNCLRSSLLSNTGSDLTRVKFSITLATWHDSETGLMSFSTDFAGFCFGRGLTYARALQ